jgi:hypothetical protein
MSSDSDFEIGVSSLEIIPEAIVGDFVLEMESCGISTSSERRPQEIYAGVEWLLPTAVVVFIAQKYVGTLLQEAAKDHYPRIKSALSKLIRRTTGKGREIFIKNIASSAHKTSTSEAVVLSVLFAMDSGHHVKFIFEHQLDGDGIEEAVECLLQLLIDHRRDLPTDRLSEIVTCHDVRVHSPVIVRFDPSKREWVHWSYFR